MHRRNKLVIADRSPTHAGVRGARALAEWRSVLRPCSQASTVIL